MTRRSHTTLRMHPPRLCSVQRAGCKLSPGSRPDPLPALPFPSLCPCSSCPSRDSLPSPLLVFQTLPSRLDLQTLPSRPTLSPHCLLTLKKVTAPPSVILKSPAYVATLIRLHCNHLYWPPARFRNNRRQEPPRKHLHMPRL